MDQNIKSNLLCQLQGLSKSYNGRDLAVDHLDLELYRGEIFGLLGPNGAGKTTTLKMLTGILAPDSGDVLLNGFSIRRQALEAKRQFAFVPDEPNAFQRLKGIEYLAFIGDIYGVPGKERKERVSRYARELGLQDVLGDRIASYSHGMRQKLAVLGAMVQQPQIWILDEPMVGLDPKSSFYLKERLREFADAGQLVIFSTHVLDVAEKICDRVGIIDRGKLLFSGSVDELRKQFTEGGSLEHMFLNLTSEYEEEEEMV